MITKVCGITTKEQYAQLAGLGVDMLGFNFYPPSKRYLKESITNGRSSSMRNVGVFVNPSVKEITAAGQKHFLNLIQLHGHETVDFVKAVARKHNVIKAFGIDAEFDFSATRDYEQYVDYFLFDTKTPLFGGSGVKFAWQKLTEYKGRKPFILSGGIQPNDAEKLKDLKHEQFIGVDLNSGFEIAPGIKDITLIKEFLTKIKHEESR